MTTTKDTMTDNALKIIKDELERINEARAKAFDSSYEFNVATVREAAIWLEKLDGRLWIRFDKGTQVDEYKAAETAQFIALAANEITNLTKALSAAVEALEDVNHGFSKSGLRYGGMQYEQISAKAITTIANILSGKDGK